MLDQIKRGFKLRKVARPEEKKVEVKRGPTEEEIAIERNNCLVELLGYMEAPEGSIDELTQKCTKSTDIARTFIYTLVRKGWTDGFRLTPVVPEPEASATALGTNVWPGREVTTTITLPDLKFGDETTMFPETSIVMRAHIYRFDQDLKQHVLDEIALVKTIKFPPPFIPFSEPEPQKGTSMEAKKMLDNWMERKSDFEQTESAQFNLVFVKLVKQDEQTVNAFNQLNNTMRAMRDMAEAVRLTLESVPLDKLQVLVNDIPKHIKEAAKRFHKDTGIIIRGEESVKLTPGFLSSIVPHEPEPGSEKVEENKKQESNESVMLGPNGKPLVTFAGIPLDQLDSVMNTMRENMGIAEFKLRRGKLTI
ncbi:hypothetical protein HK096_000254 [Nowakowskiella sp. JEL0078]|nr:hypothetical protein HK096_000254 [Nowakowskiella sp. JEL0078]